MQLTDSRDLWINVVGSVPTVGPGDARDPVAVGDPGHVTAPRQRRQSDALLDGEKTGAALLLCGVLLSLVGVTFTAMGWRHYEANDNSEWTRLLGPILISVGGTFILTSVCRFWVASCWPCGAPEDDVLVVPARDGAPGRPPFVLRGINQPVVVQGAAAMLCIPPPYGFVAPELHPPGAVSSGLPSYDAVFCVDDAIAAAEEGSSAPGAETDHRGNSSQKEEQERRRVGRSDSAVSQPPAYEDIYPPPPKQSSP